jgi:hypothetical protein
VLDDQIRFFFTCFLEGVSYLEDDLESLPDLRLFISICSSSNLMSYFKSFPDFRLLRSKDYALN